METSMNKFVATATVALIGLSGQASAQSVLERVLGQIDGATNLARVNGTFANIAESVGSMSATTSEPETLAAAQPNDVLFYYEYWYGGSLNGTGTVRYGQLGTTFAPNSYTDITINLDGSVSLIDTDSDPFDVYRFFDPSGQEMIFSGSDADGTRSSVFDLTGYTIYNDGTNRWLSSPAIAAAHAVAYSGYAQVNQETYIPGLSTTIDGSIANTITGVTTATQEAVAGAATATEFVMPTLDFGDMATTALGAVNTGDITLGVNSAVDEAATTTTRAISAVMTQVGGSADTGALVLNVASNAGAVNGSIENILASVNGSIGNLSTTALGAVNTGTITSGVNAAVQGIVGISGQTTSGL
jgi:hypothetical protein